MTPLLLSLNLFSDPIDVLPLLQVKVIEQWQSEICTCKAVRKRTEVYVRRTDPLTLKVLCQSQESLQLAFDQYRASIEHLSTGVSGILAHEAILAKMVGVCDCHLDNQVVTYDGELSVPSDTPAEPITPPCISIEPEFDADLPRYGRNSFHGVHRQSPVSLGLARLTTDKKRLKINKSIRDCILPAHTQGRSAKAKGDGGYGYIYMLKSRKHPGFVKIGSSTEDPQIRRKQLERCFKELSVFAYTNLRIPASLRVEKLIQAELTSHRCYTDCEMCSKEHTEWFEISDDLAGEVVLRWSRWMASEPYDPVHGQLKPIWHKRLSDHMMRNLEPASDNSLSENTWHDWTNRPGDGSGRDFRSEVSLLKPRRDPSPWRDDV